MTQHCISNIKQISLWKGERTWKNLTQVLSPFPCGKHVFKKKNLIKDPGKRSVRFHKCMQTDLWFNFTVAMTLKGHHLNRANVRRLGMRLAKKEGFKLQVPSWYPLSYSQTPGSIAATQAGRWKDAFSSLSVPTASRVSAVPRAGGIRLLKEGRLGPQKLLREARPASVSVAKETISWKTAIGHRRVARGVRATWCVAEWITHTASWVEKQHPGQVQRDGRDTFGHKILQKNYSSCMIKKC